MVIIKRLAIPVAKRGISQKDRGKISRHSLKNSCNCRVVFSERKLLAQAHRPFFFFSPRPFSPLQAGPDIVWPTAHQNHPPLFLFLFLFFSSSSSFLRELFSITTTSTPPTFIENLLLTLHTQPPKEQLNHYKFFIQDAGCRGAVNSLGVRPGFSSYAFPALSRYQPDTITERFHSVFKQIITNHNIPQSIFSPLTILKSFEVLFEER